ncbi:hypothetical protein AVEN_202143-1 [Araneus ventricosus]|uniref:Uncharacterized protein n=1 Tax=Araneus ventricosus TaxID=182803 RepID=A0A4Y2E2J1_ARAVE|nr:hypothetical protein AVEN_202143-1 [Araneus ventricosus]
MNRHVSKRVCLGLQFQTQTPTLIDDDVGLSVQPVISSVQSNSPVVNSAGDPPEPLNSETEVHSEGSPSKSSRVPCPYCNKLLKGERGVRKHIDFYGCPMAVSAKPAELN